MTYGRDVVKLSRIVAIVTADNERSMCATGNSALDSSRSFMAGRWFSTQAVCSQRLACASSRPGKSQIASLQYRESALKSRNECRDEDNEEYSVMNIAAAYTRWADRYD